MRRRRSASGSLAGEVRPVSESPAKTPLSRRSRSAALVVWSGADRPRTGNQPPMAPASSKTGRYIATMMPPMMPPRNTIMIGSIRAVIEATATSTSSS